MVGLCEGDEGGEMPKVRYVDFIGIERVWILFKGL
jgi:hypothetical protein